MQDYGFIKTIKLGKSNDGSQVLSLLEAAVKKRYVKKCDLLFSGGVDSTLLAKLLKDQGCNVTLIVAGTHNSKDVKFARKAAKILGLRLVVSVITKKILEKELPKIKELVGENFVKLSIAVPYYFALKKSRNKVVFTGLGSEDLFAGYKRYQGSNEKCLQGLKEIFTRDLDRDIALAKRFRKDVRTPFLDEDLVKYAVNTDEKLKVKDGFKKWVLRVQAERLIPREFAWRKRKAAQYGSGVVKMLKKLKPALGVLFTGGKDSNYALYRMVKKGYAVSCLISMESENPDSFMFHTPNIELAKYQGEALEIPLITGKTPGVEEEELEDLKLLVKRAVDEYGIRGLVTGALYSEYQRSRIEKICKELSIKCFSPLWHLDQYEYFKTILKKGFSVVFSSVAALGLDKTWVGRPITLMDLKRLKELEKRYGVNVAGEGGEFESFVLDAPLFRKRLVITDSKIVSEGEHNHRVIIKKVRLVEKH
jgi:asparagine synthase (glutamine-hydrolysing)